MVYNIPIQRLLEAVEQSSENIGEIGHAVTWDSQYDTSQDFGALKFGAIFSKSARNEELWWSFFPH